MTDAKATTLHPTIILRDRSLRKATENGLLVHFSKMNFVNVVRSVENPQLTLVLMHGLGSDEQDMYGLAEVLDSRVEVICLRAPFQYGPGYAWFDIQWTLKGIEINQGQYWESVGAVAEYLNSLEQKRLVVGGFSQGAMMSLGVITQRPELAVGAALLSGRSTSETCPKFEGPVFHAHGTFDDVIPISSAHALRETLSALGDRYEYHEYPMGHSINEQEVRDLNNWFARLIDIE